MNLKKAHLLFFLTIFESLHFSPLQTFDLPGASYGASSKILTRARIAEKAISNGTENDLKQGIELLETLIKDNSFNRLSIDDQVPIFLELGAGYQKSGQKLKEETLFLNLLSINKFKPFWIEIKARLGNLLIRDKRFSEAEELIDTLLAIPPKDISGEEREIISTLKNGFKNHYEVLLDLSEDRFNKRLYHDVITSLSPVLTAFNKKGISISQSQEELLSVHVRVLYRLGLAYFNIGDYEAAISYLEEGRKLSSISDKLSCIYKNIMLFLGRSFQKKEMLEQSFEAYKEFLQKCPDENDEIRKIIILEAAENALKLKKFQEAKKYTLEIKEKKSLKQLLLAKIHIEEGSLEEALTYLGDIGDVSDIQACLESYFLKGVIYAKKNDFEQAISYLERSSPLQFGEFFKETVQWNDSAKALLGDIYLKLSNADLSTKVESQVYLERAESCFYELYKKNHSVDAILGLASVYLFRSFILKDELFKSQFHDFIIKHKSDLNEPYSVLIDLIATTTIQNSKERLSHYESMLKECRDEFLYNKVSILIALNILSSSDRSIDGKAKDYILNIEDKLLTKETYTQNDIHLLLEVAKGLLLLSDRSFHIKASHLLDILLPLKDKMTKACQEEFLFYLHYSLVLRSLRSEDIRKQGIKVGEQFLESYPKSQYLYTVKHRHAFLLYESGDIKSSYKVSSELLKECVNYDKRPELLYLAATTSDMIDSLYEQTREYRRELYTNYSTSIYADESYFRLFPEKEYLVGAPHAISHLKEMSLKFPLSEYLIPSTYYVANALRKESGKNKETKEHLEKLKTAAASFQQAHKLYQEQRTSEKASPLSEYLESMNISALLQAGSTYLECSVLSSTNKVYYSEYAEECLNILIPIVEEKIKYYESKNENCQRMSLIYQEASYLLSLVFGKRGQDGKARNQLEFLIEWSKKRKVCGEFIAKSYLQLAIQDTNQGRFDQAFDNFELSEKAVDIKSEELLLEIGIEKSQCFKKMGNLYNAMTLLSQVINEDIASSLRIKAMILRAEIYELQKRRDLAIKQLEAAQKKGGEWGEKAQKMLEEMYGYR